jgi:hypothetical protein
VIVAEHRPEESHEEVNLVDFEKVLVENLKGRGQEANSLGPGNRVAAIRLFLPWSGAVVVKPWGDPKLDGCRPVSDSNAARASILDCCY